MGKKHSRIFNIPPEEQQTGILLWFQLIQNHWMPMFYANLITIVSLIPAAFCLYLLVNTKDLVFWAAAMVLLTVASPNITALNRICVRLVHRMPIWLKADFQSAWKQDWKISMALTAVLGLLWSVLAYGIYMVILVDGGLSVGHLLLFVMGGYFLSGMTIFGYQQAAMLDLPLIVILKNSLLLIFAGKLRTVFAVLVCTLMVLFCYIYYGLLIYILLLGWLALMVMTANLIFAPVFKKLFLAESDDEEETV